MVSKIFLNIYLNVDVDANVDFFKHVIIVWFPPFNTLAYKGK